MCTILLITLLIMDILKFSITQKNRENKIKKSNKYISFSYLIIFHGKDSHTKNT